MEWWIDGLMDWGLGRGLVVGRRSVLEGIERIDEAVAGGEEDQGAAIHGAKRGRGPSAVKDVGGDKLIVAGDEVTGALVEHDEARRIGRADTPVGVVHARAGVEVKVIAVNEDRTVGGVVRPDARAGGEVEPPEDARREGAGWRVRFHMLHSSCCLPHRGRRFEAEDFAAIVDQIDAVALDGNGRGDAALGPVVVDVLGALGDDELPEEGAGLFVEAHQDAAVALLRRVARVTVVRADVHAPASDHGCGVGFRAEFSGPFDVPAGFWVKGVG